MAFEFPATVLRWVDGDTVDLTVTLPFRNTHTDRFRLYGVDTPERGQPGHDEATAFCVGAAPVGSSVIIRSHKPEEMGQDKYGRWLAEILTPAGTLNDALVAANLAKPYFGGKKQP